MPYIKPTIVHNSEELDKAVSDCRTAIVIVNADIIPAIKEELKKEKIVYRKNTITDIEVKGGLTALVVGTVGVCAASAAAITAPAAIAFLAGTAAFSIGSAKSLSTALDKTIHKMKHYAWVETTDSDTRLLLIKATGRNKFDKKNDKIGEY